MLGDLNPEQREAVLAPEDRVLVLAGAGSGKTRTLVERVGYLMEQGASGYEIVCVTFTRAAAAEMRERLEARIGREANKVTVSTFHGLGLGLLKKYGPHIGLRYGKLSVYTPLETQTLLEDCGEMLGMYKKGKWAKPGKRELDAFMSAVERGEDEEKLKDSPFAPLRMAFESACTQNNALPYYGLIRGLVALAEADVVHQYTSWKYFLVDEVQDLDRLQWEALRLMLKSESKLFAVGDLSQSIYSFRGAVPNHLQSLIDAGRLTVYELRNNYRSSPEIVQAANSLIRHNKSHRSIEMQAALSDSPNAIIRERNMDSAALADELSKDCWNDDRPGMAVLCRNNRMLDKLSEKLTARGIEHLRIGRRTNSLHSPLFVKANAMLKCIVNPHDEIAFLLAHKGLGVSAQEYAEARMRGAAEGKSGFMAYREGLDIDSCSAIPTDDATVAQACIFFLEGRYRFDPEDGDATEYTDWLAAYVKEHPLDTIADYLNWIALADVQDELPARDSRPGLVLMTCHAAKGLEFPRVVIAGCNEGVLPGKQSLTAEKKGDTAAIEDERRLMYVAVTRARDTLILAVRPEKEDGGEAPSRFLSEMSLL